ncbi:hypothetical protein CONPUDRAFT_62453, partial [Coniophora puteana RWD-64-598 SS2]
IFRLRTGHIQLNKHMSRIDPSISPLCPGCHSAPESVHHFLAACPAYRAARDRLQGAMRSRRALDVNKLLSDPELARPLLAYVHATARFSSSLGSLEPPRNPA